MKKLYYFFIIIAIASGCTNMVDEPKTGNVIFFHPDGTGVSDWNTARILYYGPDGELNWDQMSNMAIYKSHMKNSITASSHSGATVHSYGVKVIKDSYGMDGKKDIISRSGKKQSIMHEAIDAGIRTGLVNTGSIIEPGTSAFVASVESRNMFAEITEQVLRSGVDVLLSGGEEWFLPEGTKGYHCKTGKRNDGKNLIELAKEKNYKIVYTLEQLESIPSGTEKVLGIFSEGHMFNDKTEEELSKMDLENYKPNTPTVAEMTKEAIRFLSYNNKQFYLVIEEEATDNFANKNNANALLMAMKRSDDALGVAMDFVDNNQNTLLLTTSDSDAGGMQILGEELGSIDKKSITPHKDRNGNLIDGIEGQESKYFFSAPNENGDRFPFRVSWAQQDDGYGSVMAKAYGLNADRLEGTVDNTFMYQLKYLTLFGKEL